MSVVVFSSRSEDGSTVVPTQRSLCPYAVDPIFSSDLQRPSWPVTNTWWCTLYHLNSS